MAPAQAAPLTALAAIFDIIFFRHAITAFMPPLTHYAID
jgi:hypothetical protein